MTVSIDLAREGFRRAPSHDETVSYTHLRAHET